MSVVYAYRLNPTEGKLAYVNLFYVAIHYSLPDTELSELIFASTV